MISDAANLNWGIADRNKWNEAMNIPRLANQAIAAE